MHARRELSRWVPGIALLRSYSRDGLRQDLPAGVVLAALLVPQGMAYAQLAGLPPVTGLYATLVPLVVYFLLLGRIAMAFITSGSAAAIGLGLAVLIMPLIGIWVMVSTLQAGFAHQRLARIIREEGMELDVSGLPRMPSGRIQRDAADALFETVRGELDKDPDNWRRWYRLARAYDYAGDRSRAREAMKKALELERALQERE